jgi:hypothetical protein
MGEMKEYFDALDTEIKKRKQSLSLRSVLTLQAEGIKFTVLNQNGPHLRVGAFDFWPSTGRFVHRRTKRWGRTLEGLLALLKKECDT